MQNQGFSCLPEERNLLESLHKDKRNRDKATTDPDPSLFTNPRDRLLRQHPDLGTGKNKEHDGDSDDDRGMEEPHGTLTPKPKGVGSDVLVGCHSGMTVVVEAFDEEDAGVDRHDHGED